MLERLPFRRSTVEEIPVERREIHWVRFLRALLAVAFLLSSASTAAEGVAGDSGLLSRAAAASGEPWRYHIRSTFAGSENGLLTHTIVDEQGDIVVTRRCTGVVCGGSIVDTRSRRTSLFSYNETPIAQSAPVEPLTVTIRAIVSYAFTAPTFVADGGRVAADGSRSLAGRDVVALAVTAPGGVTLDALLDPQTALLAGIARGTTILYEYDDERRIGPLMLPATIRLAGGSAERFDERTIVAAPLLPPSGPPAVFRDTLPVALEPKTIPVFACRVEGHDTRCVLDSGASGLAMSLELADRLHKAFIGRISLEGLGPLESGVVEASELDLGSLRLGKALYAVLPDVGEFGADVVVGADVMGKAVIELDMPHHTIRFDPPGTALAGSLVDLTFGGFTPSVPIQLSSKATTAASQLALDTGDASSIDLSKAFTNAHPDVFVRSSERAVFGVGGRGSQETGTIGRVVFAGFALQNVAAGVTDLGSGQVPARLGSGFLTRFAVDIDYQNARMSVRAVR